MGAVSQYLCTVFLTTFCSHGSYRDLSFSLGCPYPGSQPYCSRVVALPKVSLRTSQGAPGWGKELLLYLTFIAYIGAEQNLS